MAIPDQRQIRGYIVERPENHSVHHERGVHYYNFSDLPVFDLLFGTWRNPAEFAKEQGFYDGASSRLGAMLGFQDVSSPASLAPAAPQLSVTHARRSP
jgi:sterol desaturase/sphingolipid hydroxylase (fatty acid hydroxylase superfamily)